MNETPTTTSALASVLQSEAVRVRATVRRRELRKIVPLADTTIYEMERRGEFPRRFDLTSKCVVWDLEEVEAWLTERRAASRSGTFERASDPDVRRRKHRPLRSVPDRST